MGNHEVSAIIAIGILVVILGAVLLIPSLWFARRQAARDPTLQVSVRLTKWGWVLISTMLLVLLGGVSAKYWAEDSRFAELTSHAGGRILWYALVIVAFVVIESVLKRCGIKVLVSASDKL